MGMTDWLFYLMAFVTLSGAIGMLLAPSPIFSALFLVLSMGGVAGLFVTLNAYFIAGVQLIVYAGAVMVLFVMVLMLFNLKEEKQAFSRGLFSGALKITTSGVLAGLLFVAFIMSTKLLAEPNTELATTEDLAQLLFTKYIFGFELISLLLLLVIVGVVAIAKGSGGTHANH
jgi:NADH-quinone oxidoreductase subunit J